MIHCEEGTIGPGEILLRASWVNAQQDHVVMAAVRRMTALSSHPFLLETHCGQGRSFESLDHFVKALHVEQVRSASIERKQKLTEVRRRQFAAERAALELLLIQRDGYVCASPGCRATSDLTIDHVVAVSKGGSDDLPNLRLLCRSHNSVKGDK